MKTVKNFKNILSKADPKGFVIIIDEKDKNLGHWVTMPSNLNVETYGYELNGQDITKTHKFVGLPYYNGSKMFNGNGQDGDLTIKNEYKSLEKYGHIFSISKFLEMLSSHDDEALLMCFDGHLISKILLNGETTPSLKNAYGSWEKFYSKPNDFVYLIKGEKTKHFFRGKLKNESINNLIKKELRKTNIK